MTPLRMNSHRTGTRDLILIDSEKRNIDDVPTRTALMYPKVSKYTMWCVAIVGQNMASADPTWYVTVTSNK